MLTGNLTFICGDFPFIIDALNRLNRRVAINLSALITRAFGHRLRQISWLDIAIIGVANTADKPVFFRQWPMGNNLIRSQHFDIDTDGFCHALILHIFIHAILVCRKADI